MKELGLTAALASKFGGHRTTSKVRAKFQPDSTDSADTWPKPGQLWPQSAQQLHNSRIDMWPTSELHPPKTSKSGRFRAKIGPNQAGIANNWWEPAQNQPASAQLLWRLFEKGSIIRLLGAHCPWSAM